jgi:hypothetical protein
MKILLTPEESEEIFYNSLCNGHGLAHSGLSLQTSATEYEKAKIRLIGGGSSPCLEDVWMEILRGGGRLALVDHEGEGLPSTITLKEVHERVQTTPINHLMDAINEQDDGITAEVIIQIVFFNDVIYG